MYMHVYARAHVCMVRNNLCNNANLSFVFEVTDILKIIKTFKISCICISQSIHFSTNMISLIIKINYIPIILINNWKPFTNLNFSKKAFYFIFSSFENILMLRYMIFNWRKNKLASILVRDFFFNVLI